MADAAIVLGAVGDHVADRGPLEDGVHVDPVHERVDVDAGQEPVHVDPRQQAVDVDAVEGAVQVDPVDQLVEVDLAEHLVQVHRLDHRIDERSDQPVERGTVPARHDRPPSHCQTSIGSSFPHRRPSGRQPRSGSAR
jgi:hypothetical protein